MEVKKLKLPFRVKRPVLALGAQTKNTVCLLKGNFAYLGPLRADLSNPKDLADFEKEVKYLLKKNPRILAYDLHPEYQSSKFVQNLSPAKYKLRAIQHHHAHIASCMLENGLSNGKVIGVALDGTGLGLDNQLWGAEFLVCDYKNFKRRAHLREVLLLGGERAILEPWRIAAVWLSQVYKDEFLNLNIGFVKKIDKRKWRVLKNMQQKGFNSPLSSSMGRLFDAAGAIVLEKYQAKFEAELAIALERLAKRYTLNVKSYRFRITKKRDEYILDPRPIFKQIVSDLSQREAKEKIAYRFHLTVAQMIRKICLILRKETRIKKIVLSGGVFQNSLLLRLTLGLLCNEGFLTFRHKKLSSNDSGISLGQAVIASYKD